MPVSCDESVPVGGDPRERRCEDDSAEQREYSMRLEERSRDRPRSPVGTISFNPPHRPAHVLDAKTVTVQFAGSQLLIGDNPGSRCGPTSADPPRHRRTESALAINDHHRTLRVHDVKLPPRVPGPCETALRRTTMTYRSSRVAQFTGAVRTLRARADRSLALLALALSGRSPLDRAAGWFSSH